MEKKIQIGKKTYTLTANRRIIKTIYSVCPEVLTIGNDLKSQNKTALTDKEVAEIGTPLAIKLLANLDDLFFDMLRIAHPEITREKASDLLDQMFEEYDDVQDKLLELAMSVFPVASQETKVVKKKIDW